MTLTKPEDDGQMSTSPDPDVVTYARETAMRDCYAKELATYRPNEHEVSREALPGSASKRADLFTIDKSNIFRVWEFKIRADSNAIGQLLVYLALCRRHYPTDTIRPVLAAAEFHDDVRYAIEALNLNIEVVDLPPSVLGAGKVPFHRPDPAAKVIPT
jgi:RecB family endonuclease NucS